MRHPRINSDTWTLPQPGDYCQWDEYDAEVVECDGYTVTVNVFLDDDEYETRVMSYHPGDWSTA